MATDAPTTFAELQTFLRRRPPARPGTVCDYCSAPLESEHPHLIDLQARRILCACRPCAIVFEPDGAARGRYKRIPTRYQELDDFALDDATWDALQIPIALAFFFYNSVEGRAVAFYPGPAGATESLLPLETWDELGQRWPVLRSLAPDVEALLIRRTANGSAAFVIPIDAAYELVGTMRTNWRGFDGGEEARGRIEAFFADLRARST